MKYLVDTNVWLEVLLEQANSDEVKQFLLTIPGPDLFITDFSVHSVGVITIGRKKPELFEKFIQDILEDTAVPVVSLTHSELRQVIEVSRQHKFGFDDAYIYVAAEKFDLTIVTFDHHFDATQRGRKTPAQILQERGQQPTS